VSVHVCCKGEYPRIKALTLLGISAGPSTQCLAEEGEAPGIGEKFGSRTAGSLSKAFMGGYVSFFPSWLLRWRAGAFFMQERPTYWKISFDILYMGLRIWTLARCGIELMGSDNSRTTKPNAERQRR